MKCYECANNYYENINDRMVSMCYAQYTPIYANRETEERQCDKFISKSGKSKWDCMSKEERDTFKKCALEYASKNYSGTEIEEFVDFIVAKAKTTDSNSCQWESEVQA